jgi:hypothetical protein
MRLCCALPARKTRARSMTITSELRGLAADPSEARFDFADHVLNPRG